MAVIKALTGSIWLWIALGIIAAVVLLSVVSQKPSIDTLSWETRNSDWQQAEFAYQNVSKAQVALLSAARLWGLEETSSGDAQTSKPWTLKGIITDTDYHVAIIEVDSKAESPLERFARFREGETLPNGATLIKIHKDRVEYSIDGAVQIKRLYE